MRHIDFKILTTLRWRNYFHKIIIENFNDSIVPRNNIQGYYSNHYGMNNQYWSGFIKEIDKSDNCLQEAYLQQMKQATLNKNKQCKTRYD